MPNDVEEKIISLRIFMAESLRNDFKAVCAKQGKNMSEVVNEFVQQYVMQHENPSPKKGKGAA
jgi:antitoxin component of RelBE/YafQ-DinJ toxin-antitoxin module